MSEALSYILQLKPVCWGRSQNPKCHISFCGKVNKCVILLQLYKIFVRRYFQII